MSMRSSKRSSRKRSFRDFFQYLRFHLLGLEEDDKFKMTSDTIRIVCSYGLSFLTGLIAGYCSYWYCELDVVKYQEMNALYQNNSWINPPGDMHYVLSLLWCYLVCGILSLVFCGLMQIIIGLCFTSNLTFRKEIRTLSAALAFGAWVFIIFICLLFDVPVLYL